jgi:hypothetical protein
LVRVRKIRSPDARIAVAMPPRIGTNIMMVMCEDKHHGIEKNELTFAEQHINGN